MWSVKQRQWYIAQGATHLILGVVCSRTHVEVPRSVLRQAAEVLAGLVDLYDRWVAGSEAKLAVFGTVYRWNVRRTRGS